MILLIVLVSEILSLDANERLPTLLRLPRAFPSKYETPRFWHTDCPQMEFNLNCPDITQADTVSDLVLLSCHWALNTLSTCLDLRVRPRAPPAWLFRLLASACVSKENIFLSRLSVFSYPRFRSPLASPPVPTLQDFPTQLIHTIST